MSVPLEDAMNWSMYTADRTTHLKIVVVGLCAALLISVIAISAQQFNLGVDIMTAQGPQVYKAGAPVEFTARDSGRDASADILFTSPSLNAPHRRRVFFARFCLCPLPLALPFKSRRVGYWTNQPGLMIEPPPPHCRHIADRRPADRLRGREFAIGVGRRLRLRGPARGLACRARSLRTAGASLLG